MQPGTQLKRHHITSLKTSFPCAWRSPSTVSSLRQTSVVGLDKPCDHIPEFSARIFRPELQGTRLSITGEFAYALMLTLQLASEARMRVPGQLHPPGRSSVHPARPPTPCNSPAVAKGPSNLHCSTAIPFPDYFDKEASFRSTASSFGKSLITTAVEYRGLGIKAPTDQRKG